MCRKPSAVAAVLLAGSALGFTASGTPPAAWPGADLFTNGVIRQLRIELTPEAATRLRQQPREHVPATVTEGTNTWHQVGIHLKGATGSFRPLEDKPGLTLDFSRFTPGQKFHGLRKIHLNNSVEDPSYANEILGGELFRANGVPAPRATRALVTLNGNSRGLYVLKEGFTEDFLSCHFQRISDELYEPEDGHDIDQSLKRNSVLAPAGDGTALKALAAAAAEPDPALRWQRLDAALDTDRFLTFMSLEVMLGHRDGYCLARNNFRVYHDLDSGRMIFFPHGMDQLLGTADLPWQPALGGLVAEAVMTTPEGKRRYTERFATLLTNAFQIAALTNRVEQLVAELRPARSRAEWARVRDAAETVKERIVQRQRSLVAQLNAPELPLLTLESGAASLTGWRIAEAPLPATLDQRPSPDGQDALHIATTGDAVASWRTTARLSRGNYRFEGRVRIASVQPLPYGIHHGAGLRVRGRTRTDNAVTGEAAWRTLAADFRIEPATEVVEFICELRARSGAAWFELSSLRVVPRKDL
jgi:spore coat protein H